MKKVIFRRSLEDRASFFKKNLHKVKLKKTSSPKLDDASLHQLVENPTRLEELQDDNLDNIILDFEEI